MKSRTTAVLATLTMAAAGIATAAPARADVPCTITTFSPRTVSVGIAPKTATFGLSTAGCSRAGWSLDGDDFYAYYSSPQYTFSPYSNSEAGPQDVIATAENADWDERQRVFANGFILKRASVWQTGSFNASPEPVRKGQAITVRARLLVADWDNNRWAAYSNRAVSVQFRTSTGSYATVKTTASRADGWISTTVPAKQTGVWRVVYSGNTLAGAAVSAGDAVQVTS